MTEEITKSFLNYLCKDFENMLLEGICEDKDLFPYTIACIHFIEALKEQGIEVDFDAFDEFVQDQVYQELSNFLVK